MVWPFSSSASSAAPQATSDGAYIAPGRSARDKCWEARDAFFACLDAAGVVDSIGDKEGKEIAAKKCAAQDEALRRECASSWVTYFKQRRVMEQKKKTMLENLKEEGAKPMGNNVLGQPVSPDPAEK